MNKDLVFLKLGGSLITDKNTAHHARLEVLNRLAEEIAASLRERPGLKLLLGHGSGSFGHIPAKKYATREGVKTPGQWRGFAEVWHEACALNSIVMTALHRCGIPAVAFSPCSQVLTSSRSIINWDTTQIMTSLENGIIPVVYGDVVFDREIGGTILSTEEQFSYLAGFLEPARILLAGIEPGVWKDYPARENLYKSIDSKNLSEADTNLASSESPDVTGGMRSKVHTMMNLLHGHHCDEVFIFSGAEPGNLYRGLTGGVIGTRIALE